MSVAPARTDRRGDIQGLRAVGALLVAVFHIWFARVSGGVDVFFVVSGFLLIGSLGREAVAKGSVDVIRYAAKLAKRLLPASLFVLVVIVLTAPLWAPGVRWEPYAKHVIAAAAYLENWYLIRFNTDYLTRDAATAPVQHYWAMAVQVQALAFFGVAMWGLAWALGKTAIDRTKAVTGFLILMFVGSLAWSVIHTARDQPAAYFDTFARLWEFALGGIVALILPRLKLGEGMRLIVGWLGLALIVSCGFLLQVSTVFPGYAALWPTLGAAMVLIGGLGASRFGVARLLGSRPFTWLGDRSYGLYLWHWPILLAYLAISERTVATPLAGLVIMGASVLAADLTLRFIEGPTRYLSDAKPWRILIAGAAAVAVAGGVAVGWIGYTKFQARAEWARLADAEAYPGAAAFGRDIPEAPVTPGPFTVRADRPELYDNGCHQSETGTATPNCVYGDPDAPYTLAVVGGSHVTQWFPALLGAVEGSDWKLMIFTKSACLFRETPEPHEPPSCAVWNRNVMAELERLRPDAVFTTTTRGEYAADEIAPGYVDRWRELEALGIPIVGMRDTPWFQFDVAECVERFGRDAARCSRARTDLLSPENPTLQVTEIEALYPLDFSRFFCDETTCPAVVGNVMVYHDTHHFGATYARTLAPMLRDELMPVLDRIAGRNP